MPIYKIKLRLASYDKDSYGCLNFPVMDVSYITMHLN